MPCYKDMTFCPFWRDCGKAADCHRPLTDQVVAEAEAFGLPTAQYLSAPACHTKKEASK